MTRTNKTAVLAALVTALGVSAPAEAASLKTCGGNLEPGTLTTRATPNVSCILARKLRRLTLRRTNAQFPSEDFRIGGRRWYCTYGFPSGPHRTKGMCTAAGGRRALFIYVDRRLELAEAEREVVWHVLAVARRDALEKETSEVAFIGQITSPIRVFDCKRSYPDPRTAMTCRAEWTGVLTSGSESYPWYGSDMVSVHKYGPGGGGVGESLDGLETEWHGDYYVHSL